MDFPGSGAGRPDETLLSIYSDMACQDGRPIFVCCINGQWLALEFLEEDRDTPSYYYFHPKGLRAFGPRAAETAMEKGVFPPPQPVTSHRAQNPEKVIRRGKYSGGMKLKGYQPEKDWWEA